MEIQTIIKDIPGYNKFTKIELIRGGVSLNKYCVETSDGKKLLLEINDVSEYGRQTKVADIMNHAAAKGVPMCQPVELGICNDDKNLYQMMTWCKGNDLAQEIHKLSEAKQYALGIKAGEILRSLHSIPATDDLEDWHDKYCGIYAPRMYHALDYDIKIENCDKIIRFFEKNKHLLKHRPKTLCHGDYQTGNLIVTDNFDLYVIDWNLMEYGNNYADPWSEFGNVFCQDFYPHYEVGKIRGYFGGEPPAEFWNLFALYVSNASLLLVQWSFYFDKGQESNEECIWNVRNVLQWFDNMNNPVPTWYSHTT